MACTYALSVISMSMSNAVFSPSKFEGMRGGHDLGGVCSHIKTFGYSPFPHQRKSVLKACWADIPEVCWGEH